MGTVKKFGFFIIEMREDGILHMHAEGENTVDMKAYQTLIAGFKEMGGGKKVPILSTADDLVLPDDEVKEYLMRPEANPYALANALIAPSLPQKILGNLMIRMNKRGIPMKLFRTKEEAIEWLKTFLPKV